MRRGFRLLMAAGFMAVACGAADARCGDLDGVLTLPGYDVPSLSLDMPSLDMPALSPVYGGGAVVPVEPMRMDPSRSYVMSSRVASWDGGSLAGFRSVTSLPGLMGIERAGFEAVQQFGPVTLSLDAGAELLRHVPQHVHPAEGRGNGHLADQRPAVADSVRHVLQQPAFLLAGNDAVYRGVELWRLHDCGIQRQCGHGHGCKA